MASEFPKTYYRWTEAGTMVGRTFKALEDVEPGWVVIEELGPPPEPKPEPAPAPESPTLADKRFAQAVSENERLKDTVKLYEDFLTRWRDNEASPEALKADIGELLGEAAPAKPKTRKRRSAS